MNKTFRNLALSLAGFTMALVLLPQTVFAGETTAEDYVIEKDEEAKTCKITGYTGSSIKPDIPEVISGYKVTSIGSSAFKNEDRKVEITSVEIPKYVTDLDDRAFAGCEDLVTVKFSSSYSLKSIGAFAFNNCKALAEISIPSSVKTLGEGAFMQCSSLKSINIPSSIVDIPVNAFAYDTALSSVNFSTNTKTIGENAFALSAINKIKFPKSVESIGKKAFLNTGSMEVTFLGAVKSIDDTAFDVDDDYDYDLISFIADGNNPGDITRFARAAHVYVRYYYKITAGSVSDYGTVSVYGTERYNGDSFLAGDSITVKIHPGKKYRFVKWAAKSDVNVKFDNDILETATFRMPSANVDLAPEFVELFDISFFDEDGTTLLYKELFAKGDTVIFGGATPVKASTSEYIYKFDHWTPDLGTVTGDASYKAVYKAIPIVTKIEPTYTPVPSPAITVEPTEAPAATNTPAVTTAPEATPTTAPAAQQTGFVVKGKTAVFTKPAVVNANKVTIPATVKINGKTYKVTEIKDNAFKGNKDLTQVTIGKNITKIGKNAFNGCKNLKKVIFKSTSVTKIGKCAFKGINKKAKFTLPKKKAKVYRKMIQKAGFNI